MAVDKPPGLLVQSDQTQDEDLISLGKAFLKERDNKPGNVYLSALHRLDRPVSGLVLLAKTSKAATRMSRLFQERAVRKIYLGISRKQPAQEYQNWMHFLEKDAGRNRVHVYERPRQRAKKAVTEMWSLGRTDKKSLLWLEPHTGRPHQLRAQTARAGHPLVGDLKYGSDVRTVDQSIGLHALAMAFWHPVRAEWTVLRTDFPSHAFWPVFKALRATVFAALEELAAPPSASA
jgi:23S rRNA pseudouridine1911/1915/1917 synthase